MEVIKDVSQLKPAPASGGAGQPPTPPIRRIGRNDHFGAGFYHAGNSRTVGQVGEYYDHRPRPSGVTGAAYDLSKGFSASKKGLNYSQGTAKRAPQKPLKEGPPKPPAKKKV
jgi:hypothetical protein